jgi:hypothetical protein
MSPFYHKTLRHKQIWLMIWLTAVVLLLVGCQAGSPSPAATVNFTIPVAPEFTNFYQTYGGDRIFGEPLAPAMTDPDTGRLVQYFTRMRLEFDGRLSDTQRPIDHVSIHPLGEWAYSGLTNPALAALTEAGQERYFPETGYTVRNGFLTFYQDNYGELLFGPPISDILDEGGKRVQYFRNARLEWQPGLPLAYRVQPGLLGRAHFDDHYVFHDNVLRKRGEAQPQPAAGVDAVMVELSVRSPILYSGETQEIFVRVETVDRRPVEGAQIVIVTSYGSVTQERTLGVADSRGILRQEVDMSLIPAGEKVQLRALVYNHEGQLLGEGVVSFRTWW